MQTFNVRIAQTVGSDKCPFCFLQRLASYFDLVHRLCSCLQSYSHSCPCYHCCCSTSSFLSASSLPLYTPVCAESRLFYTYLTPSFHLFVAFVILSYIMWSTKQLELRTNKESVCALDRQWSSGQCESVAQGQRK